MSTGKKGRVVSLLPFLPKELFLGAPLPPDSEDAPDSATFIQLPGALSSA